MIKKLLEYLSIDNINFMDNIPTLKIYFIIMYKIISILQINKNINKNLINNNNIIFYSNVKITISSDNILYKYQRIDKCICKGYYNNNYNLHFNNLNKTQKYLVVIKTKKVQVETDYPYLWIYDYIFVMCEKTTSCKIKFIGTEKMYIYDSYIIKIIENSNKNIELISNIPVIKYNLVKIIAMYQRHEIINDILNEENKFNTDYTFCYLFIYSTKQDLIFIKNLKNKYDNIYYIYAPNYPLGLKWQFGCDVLRVIDYDNVLIQGSDDLILHNKINKNMIETYDFIGQIKWFVHDMLNNKYYLFNYRINTINLLNKRKIPLYLGAGKILSKKLINENNYIIFNNMLKMGLDRQSNIYGCNNNLYISNAIIVSLKGKHTCLNNLNILFTSNSTNYVKCQKPF